MSHTPTFREIEAEDIPAIFEVRVAAWQNERGAEELVQLGITPASVLELLATSHRGWLCEFDARVVGFAIGNRENGEMWVIAVRPEHERRGIGRRLLRLVEDWLFAAGWPDIWLTTDADETFRAVGFYRRLGWIDWKLEPGGDRFMKKLRGPEERAT